jgi:hypothetical protein
VQLIVSSEQVKHLKEKKMHRTVAICALALAGMLGLASCASPSTEAPSVSEAESPAATDTAPGVDTNESESDSSGMTDSSIPDGAHAATADFPFPIPDGWEEINPFTEEKIGKSLAMSAVYTRPADAQAAADTYIQLLKNAGFEIHANPTGELVHDASFIAEGVINGVVYKGGLDFDTDANGTARVVINLTERNS